MSESILLLALLFLTGDAGAQPEAPKNETQTNATQTDVYTYAEASRDGRGKFYMGREISHTMTYHGIPWLERPERVREEKPDQVVKRMKLKPDDTVVDLGAGSGYFTFRLAKLVPEGRVLAVDVQPEMLVALEAGRDERSLKNIETILGAGDDPRLPEGVDALLMVDVYHEIEHPREVMEKVVAALAPGGRVFLVEYRGEDPKVAIKPLHKMTEKQVRKEMEAVGLEWVETADFLPSQHFFVFKKPALTSDQP